MDFLGIERKLFEILDMLRGELSTGERKEVYDFVDAGEYGVALETLSSLLVEERKNVPQTTFLRMKELAEVMGIRSSVITEALEELMQASGTE